jgi:hypothetical protein
MYGHIRLSVEHIQTTREYFELIRKNVPLNEDSLCLNISLWGQFLSEQRPFKKVTPKVGANIGAITGILLRDTHRIKKKKTVEQRALIVVKKEKFRLLSPPRLIY